MNKNQKVKINMFLVFRNYCDLIPALILVMMPNFDVWYTDWRAKVTTLFTFVDAQEANKKGAAETKADVRESLIACIVNYAAKMRIYALKVNDRNLYNLADYPLAKVEKMSEAQLIAAAQVIGAKLVLIQAEMLTYGVTAGMVADYGDMVNSFIGVAPDPKTAINVKKAATAEIKRLIKEVTAAFVPLDASVMGIKLAQRLFSIDYFNARKLNQLPTKVILVRGLVTDAAGNPLGLVKMSCAALGIKRKVSAKGGFMVFHAPDGEYEFIFTRTGYSTVTHSVTIYNGTRTEVLVVMNVHAEAVVAA